MTKWYRATVTMPHDSGLPRDAVQNTWAFLDTSDALRETVALDIDTRLGNFYNTIRDYLHTDYNQGTMTVKVYDMTEPRPRFPFWDSPITVTAPSSSNANLPSEVAVCVSFQGAQASGVNMRRRRGRVYIGPLQMPGGDIPLLSNAITDGIASAVDDHLLTPTSPLGVATWAVYSPYTHHGIPVGERLTEDDEEIPDALPASFTPVQKFWVDNAFDTQRRRGIAATYRKTYSL